MLDPYYFIRLVVCGMSAALHQNSCHTRTEQQATTRRNEQQQNGCPTTTTVARTHTHTMTGNEALKKILLCKLLRFVVPWLVCSCRRDSLLISII